MGLKLLINGEVIQQNDQRLLMETFEDKEAFSEGIIVWKRVEQEIVGGTYTMFKNGLIRRYE